MKTLLNYNAIFVLLALMGIWACSADSDVPDVILSEDTECHIAHLNLNISKENFDVQNGKGTTRSSLWEWKDGDMLYLFFVGDSKWVQGDATYNAADADWTVRYYGSLLRDQTKQVYVHHISSVDSIVNDTVHFSTLSCVYEDKSGTYSYPTGGTLTITANLTPITSRVRLKGMSGTVFRLGGLEYYNMYHSGHVSTSNFFVDLVVGDDGYTPYIYANIKDKSSPKLVVNQKEGDYTYTYTASCSSSMFQVGHSGCVKLPSASSYNGWSRKQTSGETDGHRWIDLGVYSGTKWADQNLGADISEYKRTGDINNLYGNWYCWGATEKLKLGVNDSTYEKSASESTSSIRRTSNDIAYVLWGKNWNLPTHYQCEELETYCSVKWVDKFYGNNDAGLVVEGMTGEVMFLPAAGFYSDSTYDSFIWTNYAIGKEGLYWTSDYAYTREWEWNGKTYYEHYAYSMDILDIPSISWGKWPPTWAFPIRPVLYGY